MWGVQEFLSSNVRCNLWWRHKCQDNANYHFPLVFTWAVTSSFLELSVSFCDMWKSIPQCCTVLSISWLSHLSPWVLKKVFQNICLFFWLRLRRNVRYPDIQEVRVLINLLKLFRKPIYVPSLVHVVHTLPVIGFYVLES